MTTRSIALRIADWRHALSLRQLIIGAVFLLPLVVGGLLAIRVLRPAAAAEILPGQTLASDIARAAARTEGVQLATMPSQETLTWVIDFGPPPGAQEAITVPLRRTADPAYYQYVSGSPDLSAAAGAASGSQSLVGAAQPHATAIVTGGQSPKPDDVASIWMILSGDWYAHDGIYSQRDTTVYDSISMLNMAPQTDYRFEAKLRLGAGDMGGGLIYNAPQQTIRNGAQSIDFDSRGGFLRWGRYDANGTYVYGGGIKLDKPINDGQWHTLRVETRAASSIVTLDGREIGVITNSSAHGYLGLTTSKTQVDFNDISVTILPAMDDRAKR